MIHNQLLSASGLELGLKIAMTGLKSSSKPISSKPEKAQVAAECSLSHGQVDELVAKAAERIGNEEVVSVEEARTTAARFEFVGATRSHAGLADWERTANERACP